MRRTAGTRDRKGREVMGWIRGGHQALADRLAAAIEAHGGQVLTRTRVQFIASREGRVTGVGLEDGVVSHDAVVSTLLRPAPRAAARAAHAPPSCRPTRAATSASSAWSPGSAEA